MNPLRFRLLPEQRGLNPQRFRIRTCCVALSVMLFSPVAFSADHKEEELEKAVTKVRDACVSLISNKENSIFTDEKARTLKSDFDPKVHCNANLGDEYNSHNAKALSSPVDVSHKRPSFLGTPYLPLKDIGTCRAAYSGITEIYDSFVKQRDDYCDTAANVRVKADLCDDGKFTKKCAEEWKLVVADKEQWIKQLKERQASSKEYLWALMSAAYTAHNAYVSDYTKLEPVFGKRFPAAVPKTPVDAVPDAPGVKPSDGNKITASSNSLADYYSLLAPPDITAFKKIKKTDIAPTEGLIIEEHATAKATLEKFRKKFSERIEREIDRAQSDLKLIKDELARAEKMDSVKGSGVSGLLKNTSDVAAVAPAAQALLAKPPAAAAAAAVTSGSHAPIAEIAAVGAVGALAAQSFGKNSGSSSAPSPGEIAPPPAATAPAAPTENVTKFGDHTDAKPTSEKPLGPVTPGAGPKGEPTTADAGGGSPGGSGGSDGSSRMPSNAKKNAHAATPAASGTAVDAGGAGTPDSSFGSFNQNLEPKPVPKANASNPGSEVANLLGQMKNLFNFDEGNPAGMGGATAPPGGSASSDPYNPGPGGPESAGGATEPPASEDSATAPPAEESAEKAAAADSDNPYAQHQEVRGNPFGKVDTSLFARVRSRHHRCMEKGLVLYGLKERVE